MIIHKKIKSEWLPPRSWCNYKYVPYGNCSYIWKKVTCKNCLRLRQR